MSSKLSSGRVMGEERSDVAGHVVRGLNCMAGFDDGG